MKSTIGEIVGKEVTGVVVAYNAHEPRKQVFLRFRDGTYLELWGESFSCTSAIDRGGLPEILAYTKAMGAYDVVIYPEGSDAAAP